MSLTVHSLFIYPVKGARAIGVSAFDLERRGPKGDRRWIIADEDGKFLAQRNCATLAQLVVEETDHGLQLRMGSDEIFVERCRRGSRACVTVWKDNVDALSADDGASLWLTRALGRRAQLYYMDDQAERTTSGDWRAPSPVSFADAYPLLVTTTASLAALNAAMQKTDGEAIGMDRFRPNIVIEGADPWAEDYWRMLKIGGAEIEFVKPCTRCVVTTRDQVTGEGQGKEPLQALSRMRRSAQPGLPGVLFGWNAIVRGMGEIKTGDAVNVHERRAGGWPLA